MPKIVKSADRTLRVLEFFALVRRPATASEIEVALDLPQSSTSVLLHSLEELGYLEYLPPGRMYRPTLRVAVLGDWLKPGLSINLMTERLDELREKTCETVMVGRQQGCYVQYVHILLPTTQGVQFYMQEGAKRPLSTSASGRVLLSALTDQAVRRIARRNNAEAKTKALRVDEDVLLASVRKVRRTGISETDAALGGEREIHAIAMTVPRKISAEQISLGIAGPRERVLKRRAELIETLRKWVDA